MNTYTHWPLGAKKAKRVHPIQNMTIEPWDNTVDVSNIAEKFFGADTPYKGDNLVEKMTLDDGILKMPKEDNNQKHDGGYEPIEYEIGITTETDYVPIKITWKGQYPTIRKKNLEDEWEEEYDLLRVGNFDYYGDGYYYKLVGSRVESVNTTNLGIGHEIPQDVFKYAHNVINFNSAFKNHKSLTSIPSGLFDNCPKATNFILTFYGCSNLISIPEGLFDNNTAVTSFNSTFYDCFSLTSVPKGLFDKNTAVTNFTSTFDGCYSLTSIPKGLFDNCPKATSFYETFDNCSSLTSIPEGLFDKNTAVTEFTRTFFRCSSLTGSTPTVITKDGNKYKLWELAGKPGYAKEIDGLLCFYNCTKLEDFNTIPNYWANNQV